MKTKVLVTGADQHQGLAVIRGLGMAGVPVIAASPVRGAIGHASRYASERAYYTPPQKNLDQFVGDIIAIAERHSATMIMPAAESTLVALDGRRQTVDSVCPLAAPDSQVLNRAVDKIETYRLANHAGVPVPRTVHTDDLGQALKRTNNLRFPVVLKPRGNALHASTHNRLGFKVKYARSRKELESALVQFDRGGSLPLIQEFVRGHGVNVTALYQNGRPVVMVPYEKVREVPLTGGVSVLRQTLAMEERLQDYVTRLLQVSQWHGVAMVEFKFDPSSREYVLMEINGRYCASTALIIDAGVNLPYLAYRVYAGQPVATPQYRIGVTERWLRGDFSALTQHLTGMTAREAVMEARHALPSRFRAVLRFIAQFRPGMRYDEFKWGDPGPGIFEMLDWLRASFRLAGAALRRLARAVPPSRQ